MDNNSYELRSNNGGNSQPLDHQDRLSKTPHSETEQTPRFRPGDVILPTHRVEGRYSLYLSPEDLYNDDERQAFADFQEKHTPSADNEQLGLWALIRHGRNGSQYLEHIGAEHQQIEQLVHIPEDIAAEMDKVLQFVQQHQRLNRKWDPRDTHGPSHVSRVVMGTSLLLSRLREQQAQTGQEDTTNWRGIIWAAATHDIDPVSSVNSVQLVQQNRARIPLSDQDLQTMLYLVRWHQPQDAESPEMTRELSILKDIDSLERLRLGDFDEKYVRNPETKEFIPLWINFCVKSSALVEKLGWDPRQAVTALAELYGIQNKFDRDLFTDHIFKDAFYAEKDRIRHEVTRATTVDAQLESLQALRVRYGNISSVWHSAQGYLEPDILKSNLDAFADEIAFLNIVAQRHPWINLLHNQDKNNMLGIIDAIFQLRNDFPPHLVDDFPLLFDQYKKLHWKIQDAENSGLSPEEERRRTAITRYEDGSYNGRSIDELADANYEQMRQVLDSEEFKQSPLGQALLQNVSRAKFYATHFTYAGQLGDILNSGEIKCAAELSVDPNPETYIYFTLGDDCAMQNHNNTFWYISGPFSAHYSNGRKEGYGILLDMDNPDVLEHAYVRTAVNTGNPRIIRRDPEKQNRLDAELYPGTSYREVFMYQLYQRLKGNLNSPTARQLMQALNTLPDDELSTYIDRFTAGGEGYAVSELIIPSHVPVEQFAALAGPQRATNQKIEAIIQAKGIPITRRRDR